MVSSERSYQLDILTDPTKCHEAININGCGREELVGFIKLMITIRKVEQKLAAGRRDGLIGGPVHLGVGQEAIAVGVSESLTHKDRIFGAHRSHSHLLALNPDPYKLFAEVLGRKTGFSRGMGGSMHLWDQPSGFYGSVPIVSGTVSLAVGSALAAKLQNTNDISVAYFGDGAMEEGVVHESLNLSRIQNVPILFVVENNLFASHMHISLRQPSEMLSRFAIANHIPHKIVDGNDVVAVRAAASELINSARNGEGPGFLELITYRWYGHVDWRDDIDVGINRSLTEVNNWRNRDPINRLSQAMIQNNMWTSNEEEKLGAELDEEINKAWEDAMNAPFPDDSATIDFVYSRKN